MKNFIIVRTTRGGTIYPVATVKAQNAQEAKNAIFPISKDLGIPGIELQALVNLTKPVSYEIVNGKTVRS